MARVTYRSPPLTTPSGVVVVGTRRIIYDIVLHFEETGVFPTLSDIEARAPHSNAQRSRHVWRVVSKLIDDGVLEWHPLHIFKVPKRIRIARVPTKRPLVKLTASGIFLRGRALDWYLLVEGFEERLGAPPHIALVTKAAGIQRRWTRWALGKLVRKGVLVWVDNKHIGINRTKVV